MSQNFIDDGDFDEDFSNSGNFMDDNTSFSDFDEGDDSFIEDTPYNDITDGGVPDEPQEEKQVNLGYKSVGAILAVCFVLVAIILLFFSNIHIKKKDTSVQQGSQQTVQNTVASTEAVQQSTTQAVQQQTQSKGVSLTEVGSDIKMTYNENILETSGVITSKKIFLTGKQLVYCIDINVVGTAVSYYCNYGSYTSVSVGDTVNVKYQLVDDDYISVFEIAR